MERGRSLLPELVVSQSYIQNFDQLIGHYLQYCILSRAGFRRALTRSRNLAEKSEMAGTFCIIPSNT
jgi:hypothetical protein